MLQRIALPHQKFLRSAFVAKPPIRALLRRSLHNSSRLAAGPPHGGASSDPETPSESQQSAHKRTRSTRFPALIFLVLGLPLGWYYSQVEDGSRSEALDTSRFVDYVLVAKETVSSTCAILTLKPKTPGRSIPTTVPDAEWSINCVEIKQPQLQIVRSYTCLPPLAGQGEDELRFLIRREGKGEVSNYLHRLSIGSLLEIRGPYAEYVLPPDIECAIFLAGGTGIAPALQAADVLDGEADLHIMWASKRREDCIGGMNDTPAKTSAWSWWSQSSALPLQRKIESEAPLVEKGAIVSQLEYLKRSFASGAEGKHTALTVDYFIDEEGAAIPRSLLKSIMDARSGSQVTGSAGRKVIFVSGPNGFISHWAGPKQWAYGQELQGPLGGVLSTLQMSGWEVVKL